MTANPTLDRIHDDPAPATDADAVDANGDPIDDFGGGVPSWPTLDHSETPTAADVVPAADSVSADDAAASAGGEEPVTAELVKPQAEIEFPEHLLADAGLTADQARQQFRTPDALEAALNFHLQQVVHAGRTQRSPTSPQPQPTNLPAGLQGITPPQPSVEPARQPAGPAPSGLPTKGWYKPFAEVVRSMKDSDGDPVYADETIKLIEAMDAHNTAQFDALTNALGPMVVRSHQGFQQLAVERAQQAVEQNYQAMERRFADLGDEWADTFGKGDGRELVKANPTDPAVQARVKVAETMESLKQGRANMGLQLLDDDTLFQQALRAEFNPKLQELVQRGVDVKRAGRNNLKTIRPTQRKTPAASQNQRTLAAVEKVLQQRGRSLGPPGEEVIEGF